LELPPKMVQQRMGYASIASPWTYTVIYFRAAMTVPSWRRPRRLCSRSPA